MVDFYDNWLNATDEREKARLLAQVIEELKSRFPDLQRVATRDQLRETG